MSFASVSKLSLGKVTEINHTKINVPLDGGDITPAPLDTIVVKPKVGFFNTTLPPGSYSISTTLTHNFNGVLVNSGLIYLFKQTFQMVADGNVKHQNTISSFYDGGANTTSIHLSQHCSSTNPISIQIIGSETEVFDTKAFIVLNSSQISSRPGIAAGYTLSGYTTILKISD